MQFGDYEYRYAKGVNGPPTYDPAVLPEYRTHNPATAKHDLRGDLLRDDEDIDLQEENIKLLLSVARDSTNPSPSHLRESTSAIYDNVSKRIHFTSKVFEKDPDPDDTKHYQFIKHDDTDFSTVLHDLADRVPPFYYTTDTPVSVVTVDEHNRETEVSPSLLSEGHRFTIDVVFHIETLQPSSFGIYFPPKSF